MGLLGAASAFALLASAPIHAQTEAQANAASEADEDIIVTAQFRSQRLQDTPIAITALSGEALDRKALNSVADIAAAAPNVNIAQGSGAYGSGVAVYIRGIGQYDTNFALEPGVGMYVDDAYHGVMVGSMFDLLDLDRVEILRGPQGTLAGKNSIGGAVKLYSRKPTGSGEGYVQATLGSFDRIDIRGAFDLKLMDNLFLRVSAFSKRRDGHVTRLDFACDQPALAGGIPNGASDQSCKIGTLGGVKAWGARAALRWEATPDIEVNIIGTLVRDDSEAAGAEQTYANAPTATLNGVPYDSRFLPKRPYTNYNTFLDPATGWRIEPLATTHSQSISGQINWTLSEALTLTSITAYEDLTAVWTIDQDGSPIGVAQTRNSTPYHQFTQELRLNGNTGNGLLLWTLGGFYFDSRGFMQARVQSGSTLNFIQNDPVDNNSKSLFAHAVLNPIENLNITAGIRYTKDEKSYTFYRANPNGGPAAVVGSLSGVSRGFKGDSFDYRLGADYRFAPELMAYVNFSTGYKGGGINPRPFIPSQVVPFRPERVNAYEVGFKSDLFDRALRLNVSAFLNKYRDVILIDGNGFPGAPGDADYFPFSAVPFNAGKADIKGIEVEATLKPTEGFDISGSVSYLHFKYKTLDANAVASGIGLDFVPPFTPEWKWSIAASYRAELGNGATITPQFDIDSMSD
ncbi:MAG: TonB-dependent receptor, partial [Sphingomonadales bacterium]|nr:TonB-dependent receptor [Sphingomonadales bacterium]